MKVLDEGKATPDKTLKYKYNFASLSVHHSYCHFPLGQSREQQEQRNKDKVKTAAEHKQLLHEGNHILTTSIQNKTKI